jgi:hypothetical protein
VEKPFQKPLGFVLIAGVRKGLKRKHASFPDGECPFCLGEITCTGRAGEAMECDAFAGVCTACDIDFIFSVRNGVNDAWCLDAPDPSLIKTILRPDQLAALNTKFQLYATIGPRWEAFLARRRPGDDVGWYMSPDERDNGFTVLRRGRPISRFMVFDCCFSDIFAMEAPANRF